MVDTKMIKEIKYTDVSKEALEQLAKGGAFLTSCYDGKINTMTIGWGTIGIIWGKPVMTVAVRYSRHTYNLIDGSGEFSVSFPKQGLLSQELVICGTKSGRTIDKFDECGFKPIEAMTIKTPVIDKCHIHFECRVIYRQALEPALIDEKVKDRFYKANNDFHVIFYGEITRCCINE
jgi:flavin reductase (DIM6/NTAB) family NADH-FMN oxidoreductase RutF